MIEGADEHTDDNIRTLDIDDEPDFLKVGETDTDVVYSDEHGSVTVSKKLDTAIDHALETMLGDNISDDATDNHPIELVDESADFDWASAPPVEDMSTDMLRELIMHDPFEGGNKPIPREYGIITGRVPAHMQGYLYAWCVSSSPVTDKDVGYASRIIFILRIISREYLRVDGDAEVATLRLLYKIRRSWCMGLPMKSLGYDIIKTYQKLSAEKGIMLT